MSNHLTRVQQAALANALQAARHEAAAISRHSPTQDWLAVIRRLLERLQEADLPNASNICFSHRVLSFLDQSAKDRYYQAHPEASEAERQANGTLSNVCTGVKGGGVWNLFLSAAETGGINPGGDNWHCVGVVKHSQQITITTSEAHVPTGHATVRHADVAGHSTILKSIQRRWPNAFSAPSDVRLQVRPSSEGAALDCVRFALHRLIDIIERITKGEESPDRLASLTLVSVVR